MVIIPVKYDFGELWRWSVILDRFSLSAGNTVGIITARVGVNVSPGVDDIWLLEDLKQARSISHEADIRETVVVWALDPPVAAAALPDLLPKLGIPVDAVGIVYHAERFVRSAEPASASAQSGSVVATANSVPQDSAGAVSAGSGGSESAGDAPPRATTDVGRAVDVAPEEQSTERRASGVDIPKWVVAGTGGAMALAILGAGVFLTGRWRRRRA